MATNFRTGDPYDPFRIVIPPPRTQTVIYRPNVMAEPMTIRFDPGIIATSTTTTTFTQPYHYTPFTPTTIPTPPTTYADYLTATTMAFAPPFQNTHPFFGDLNTGFTPTRVARPKSIMLNLANAIYAWKKIKFTTTMFHPVTEKFGVLYAYGHPILVMNRKLQTMTRLFFPNIGKKESSIIRLRFRDFGVPVYAKGKNDWLTSNFRKKEIIRDQWVELDRREQGEIFEKHILFPVATPDFNRIPMVDSLNMSLRQFIGASNTEVVRQQVAATINSFQNLQSINMTIR